MSVLKKGIVLAEFGNREQQIKSLVKNIRTVSTLPIVVYSDKAYSILDDDVVLRVLKSEECLWQGHRRYHNRNNDCWKIVAAMREFELALILDDDMRIVNEQFIQGFDLVENFGMCLPLNPRTYFGLDREVGDDVDEKVKIETKDCPYYITANNMGVIFLNTTNNDVGHVTDYYLSFMKSHPCRGPVAMAVACWRRKFSPYFLPEEWCACGGYTAFKQRSGKQIPPVFLHVGHPDVNQWFENEPVFERFRR